MLRFAVKSNSAHAVNTPNHPTTPPGTPTPAHPSQSESSPLKSGGKLSDPETPITTVIGQQRPEEEDDSIPVLQDRRDSHPAAQESKLKTALNPFHLSLILENRGSVARDHLALERTYLAYVRTSLAISSAGVALVQLFSISRTGTHVTGSKVARTLGSLMIFYGFIVLALGTFRYFRVQQTLPRGFFPTSMHGVAALAFFLGAFITVVFGLLVSGQS